jgi:hypothetical protein
LASLKSNVTEVLGILFACSSPIPLVFSFVHVFIFPYSVQLYVEFTFLNYYQVFLLYSFFIMILLGWGLFDKSKWSKEAAILFMIISIVLGFSSIFAFGISHTSAWSESLFWTMVNIIYLGILLYVFPWNSLSHSESGSESKTVSHKED